MEGCGSSSGGTGRSVRGLGPSTSATVAAARAWAAGCGSGLPNWTSVGGGATSSSCCSMWWVKTYEPNIHTDVI